MYFPRIARGPAILTVILSALVSPLASAVDEVTIVFEKNNNRSLPLDAVKLEGGKFVLKTPVEGFPNTPFNTDLASHISGEKPPQIDEAVALLLLGKPSDALTLLEPILEKHEVTAKIPGNYWIAAARAALVANSINRSTARCNELGKAISEATPAPGDDPSVALSRAMLTPLSVSIDDRIGALAVLAADSSPPEVAAYSCFFRGNLLKTAKKPQDALDAYLSMCSVYPTSGRVINAAGELSAANILADLGRREEAVLLLEAALRDGRNTAIGTEAEKRIPLVK